MEKEKLETYALAGIGLVCGVYKYYIRDVVADKLNAWFEAHVISQEELDKYIGEIAGMGE